MKAYHGIIFAYSKIPSLGELVNARTSSSLPFCGRYRLVDFPLSSLHNAGVVNVGVVLQRDYQSLLDHLGSGKAWDMSRRSGGLRLLPPFGLSEYHSGSYTGTIEALNAVASYIKDIHESNVILMLGNMCANIDLNAAIASHEASGADITAVCSRDYTPAHVHHRCIIGEDGMVESLALDRTDAKDGLWSLETYIIKKSVLVSMMDRCAKDGIYLFHQALPLAMREGVSINSYIHEGYAAVIKSVDEYYKANMDMLRPEVRRDIFTPARPILTKTAERVSTFYSEEAVVKNSLIGDGCFIEGELENCIVFPEVRIAKGAKLKNCIIMRASNVGEGADLKYVIADKYAGFAPGTVLTGNEKLPIVVPKGSKL